MLKGVEEGQQIELFSAADQVLFSAGEHTPRQLRRSVVQGLCALFQAESVQASPHGQAHQSARAASDVQPTATGYKPCRAHHEAQLIMPQHGLAV
jgi:hypothetical protein